MYDAIVVGARCAGSPTALLLARRGYKVLLLDRATFPSDMPFSNHYVHQTGAARLNRWGLLDKLAATGCPPIVKNRWDYGNFTLTGSPPPAEGTVAQAFAPRRKVLDPLLAEAAVAAGAELRDGFSVQELIWENDRVIGVRGRQRNGGAVSEKARITIGADGMFSMVARSVNAPEYDHKPSREGSWYSYWSGLSLPSAWYLWIRPQRVLFAFPTNENLSLVGVAFAAQDLTLARSNIEQHYMQAIAKWAPDLNDLLQSAQRESRFVGGAIPAHVRRPYGPGWALVGDAGYQKDPCTASGITDAFGSAELLADAIDAGFSGREPLEEALAGYEQKRNQAELPYYELTAQLAAFEPPPPEMQQLLAALVDNPEQRSRWFGVLAHTVPVQDFLSPQNMQQIISGAGKRAVAS
jgi:flavin-dependent dehydrogenase